MSERGASRPRPAHRIPPCIHSSPSLEPPKPSKAALKRAAREARQAERRQQKLASVAQPAAEEPVTAPAAPEPAVAVSVPPVDVPAEAAPVISPPTVPTAVRPPAPLALAKPNGHVAPAPLSPSALRTRHADSGPPVPMSPRKRRASQDTPGRPPLPKEPKIELAVHSADGGVTTTAVPVTVAITSQAQQNEAATKFRNAGIRTLWTLIMIGGFVREFLELCTAVLELIDMQFSSSWVTST